jgi:uncharacterized repeat protein (TIGR03806 family)
MRAAAFVRAAVVLWGAVALDGCGEGAPVRAPFGFDTRPLNPTCVAPGRPTGSTTVTIGPAFANLKFSAPVAMRQAPGDPSRWFLIQKTGQVMMFPNDPSAPQSAVVQVADLSSLVNAVPGEGGLLGFAFHPSFASNHYVFFSYTAPSASSPANLRSTITRFTMNADGTLVASSNTPIFPPNDDSPNLADQPYENHNGGNILFGPDGYLYFGLGDGGSGGDPQNRSQNLTVVFGKMLRLDVDNTGGKRYGVPADNPFASGPSGNLPEIFAWGLRNPWRWSFDKDTGELWVGDVGQNLYEEIDKLQLGGNYGWHIKEGFHCYAQDPCDVPGLIDPIVEYPHPNGNGPASVTGGYVYRGSAIPSLQGTYLYADEVSGELFGIVYDAMGKPQHTKLGDVGGNPSSFAEGLDGELYVLDFTSGKLTGFSPPTAGGTNTAFPQKLSQTGCVDPANPTRPADGLIPYGVNVALWSDGADKQRWMAIPDGTQIHVNDDGDWDLPVGSVLMKQFSLGGKPVETRLLMLHPDGVWAGYSYEWDDDGTDATLLPAGKTKTAFGQKWTFPSRSECLACHTAAAGRSLGPETLQLNGDFTYEATRRISNQIATLDHLGLFDAAIGDPTTLPALPSIDDGNQPVDTRARAYLHANCSFCHRPNSTGQGPADFRFATDFAMTNVCNAMPQEGDLGVMGSRLLVPGAAAQSIMSLRMHALDVTRMPPLATSTVDATGTQLIDDWIRSLTACP